MAGGDTEGLGAIWLEGIPWGWEPYGWRGYAALHNAALHNAALHIPHGWRGYRGVGSHMAGGDTVGLGAIWLEGIPWGWEPYGWRGYRGVGSHMAGGDTVGLGAIWLEGIPWGWEASASERVYFPKNSTIIVAQNRELNSTLIQF